MFSSTLPYLVAIGYSAGGHAIVSQILGILPETLGAPVLIVPHMSFSPDSVLPQVLQRSAKLPVRWAKDDEEVSAGNVYVLPPGKMMTMHGLRIVLRNREEAEIRNHAISIFFESIAGQFRERAIAVILSGLGSDGVSGANAIYEQGGTVLVQDPLSAQFSSLPAALIRGDHPQHILSPEKLASKLIEILGS
jgi:two-component system, chemotaxis family, protein-glutamate methylesterase/glutaminase